MTAVEVLGAVSAGSLAISGCYLWRVLRDIPASRRVVDLLVPASQLAFVACAYSLGPYFEKWYVIAALAAVSGILCSFLNPLFFRSLLAAERAGIEAERADMLESQLLAQRHYSLLMERMDHEGRAVRRLLDRELALVESSLRSGDVEGALSHLEGATGTVRAPGPPICQHPVVAALLLSKSAWCAESGIDLQVDVTVPDDLSTPDVELCALFSNALDNAANAAIELPASERWIKVAARPEKGYFLLSVENSCPRAEPPRKGRRRGEQVTLPRHGLGLSIMRGIAKRHDGELVAERGDGTFRLDVIWRCRCGSGPN